jgi:membrane protease YdiL (CAAX protease family)
MIKATIGDLFKFLRKPNDQQIQLNVKHKISFLLILLAFEIIITIIIIFPTLDVIDNVLNIKVERINYSNTFLHTLLLLVIVIPLIEELIFRYILKYQGIKTKFISLNKWKKIFPFLVYLLAISFGFAHLSNYLNESNLFFILSPFIILTQLLGGLVIAFIRIRLNFFWGVLYHWLWNFVVVIAIPISENIFTETYIEKNSNYTITIEEKPYFDKRKLQTIKIDSTNSKIYSLNVQQFSIQHVLDTLYKKEEYYVDDVLINLNFKSKQGLKKEEFIKILKKEYIIE